MLAAVTLGVFWPVTDHEFVEFDDQDYVTENPQVKAGLTWKGAAWAFQTGHAGNWHPLTWLSHMLDVEWFGLNPGAHHVTSLVLHTINAILLFLLLRSMTGTFWRSAFVAALFALHPMHVESVAWVSERKDVLSGLFFMLTLWAYAQFAKLRGPSASNPDSGAATKASMMGYYLAALGLFACGLMSKPMLVTVPCVLLLLDYWPLQRFRPNREGGIKSVVPLLLEKVPFFLLTVISSVITLNVQRSGGAVATLESFPIQMRFANALVGYARYLQKLFWPDDLAAFYPYPASWPPGIILTAAVVLIGLTVVALLAWRSRPYLFSGWFWFLGMLVPVIGLLQVGIQSIADRYTYLPAIGLFIGVAWCAAEIMGQLRHPALLKLAGGFVLVACALLTRTQTWTWRNTETLFSHALRVTSNNALAEYTLGAALARAGKIDQAWPHFVRALKIKPDHGEALNNLGLILVMKGQLDEGIRRYRQALKAGLNIPALHYNLGSALATQGKLEEAVSEYEAVLRLDPAFSQARCELALALLKLRKPQQAKEQALAVLRVEPGNPDARIALGLALAAEKQFDQAVGELEAVLKGDSQNVKAHFELGNILLDAGKTDEARTQYRSASLLQPNSLGLMVQEAQAWANAGHLEGAILRYKAAQLLAPDDANLRHKLGLILVQAGQLDEAIAQFREVVRLRPDAQAHYNLALTLSMRRDNDAAIQGYREAVRLQPDWTVALNELAWILATDPDPKNRNGAEAIGFAEKACQLTSRKEARFLGTLDACYAEAGRFAEAIATAKEAERLATESGQKELAEAAAARIKLYEAGQPYRQAPGL